MHLKSLALRGFKSFAQATTLTLDPGIICIVGPNGSGKSNIVDALAWVMGEQGAKSLRGAQMADVIFAGTSTRPALGRAEVRLTIDNTSGELPIDYSEVTISRTLFRQGGSEYAINGAPVRLLDIQELLSDTGMGRSMHVIVGQGQLDDVLRSDAQSRRAYIEEAAGVLKHRRRKERAVRKLEGLGEKLERLEDLTREIGRQLGPLAKQARIASQAQTIQAIERDLRARLLADDLVTHQQALEEFQRKTQQINAQRSEIAGESERLRAALVEAEEQAVLDEPARVAAEQWKQLTSLADRLGTLATLATERAEQLAQPLAGPGGPDQAARDAEIEQLSSDADEAQARCDQAKAGLEQAVTAAEDAEKAEREADQGAAGARAAQAAATSRQSTLAGQAASARSRAEAAVEALRRAESQAQAAHERAEAAAKGLEQADDGEHSPGEDDAPTRAYEAAQRDQREAQATLEQARAALSQATKEVATWTSRRDALALSLRPPEATGALLGANLPGLEGPLAPSLDVDRGWEDAVGHTLGEVVGAAIASGADAAADAVAHAARTGVGRVSLVLADAQAPSQPGEPLPGDARWAGDVVRSASAGVTDALRALLTGVAVAHTLDEAREAVNRSQATLCVTDTGEWVRPGAMGGGTAIEATVLSIQAECDEASAQAERANLAQEDARVSLESAERAERECRERAAAALTALRAADAQRAEEAQRVARIRAAAASAAGEAERAEAALTRARDEVATRESAAEAAEQALAAFTDTVEDVDVAGREREAAAAREAARKAREVVAEARLALRATEERTRQVQGRLRHARADREQYASRVQQVERDNARRQAQRAVAAHVADQAQRAQRLAGAHRDAASRRQREAEEARAASSKQLSDLRHQLDALAAKANDLTEALHREEVAAAQHTLQVDQLTQAAADELAIEPDELVAQYGPHTLVPNVDDPEGEPVPFARAAVEKRLRRAQRDLKALGKVNPLALEEHRALEERYRFMTDQLADVKRSRADLFRVISEVDRQVEEAFTSAFEDTARAFEEVFGTLFPGGEGHLVLTDPDDMLGTGVDIEARPAGKKVKQLSLLSGGERSLAALAFLFAIFKARPSPFYILDEVEAALDDANLTRMLAVFSQLREVSQLIVITHQKRTMEVADALYGVTMKDGVTTVVSQRLERTATKR